MADRLMTDEQQLRMKLRRLRDWARARHIDKRIFTATLRELASEERARARSAPPTAGDGMQTAGRPIVPLSAIVHETKLDVRTVEGRLNDNGVKVDRSFPRHPLVDRDAALAAVAAGEHRRRRPRSPA